MSDPRTVRQTVLRIHHHLEQAEYALSRLGPDLQFLVRVEGNLEIVRRTRRGETQRPKEVIARLDGCDPMLWRPEYPRWLWALTLRAAEIEPPIPGPGGALEGPDDAELPDDDPPCEPPEGA